MLLQSIKLENFRQFKDEYIEFSTNKFKNVTIIFGENGTGKTTFAQAFFWCLYGEADFNDRNNLLNKSVEIDMIPGQEKKVEVELKLKHGTNEYTIRRHQYYKKTNSRLTIDNSVLSVTRKSEDGETKAIKKSPETEIKKILPKELARYFFFDGERIDKFSKEITNNKNSTDFKEAVTGLSGLQAVQEALALLDPGKSNSVYGQLEASYVKDFAGKISRLTEKIQATKEEINSIKNRLEDIEDDIKSAESIKRTLEDEIKQYEEGKKLQEKRDKLNYALTIAKKRKSYAVKQAADCFRDNMTKFFEVSMVKETLEILAKSKFGDKDIPEMHSKTIQYLLNKGTCICGTRLDPGTIPYEKVMELMDYLPPQSIGVTVGQFIKESRNLYRKEDKLLPDLKEHLRAISDAEDSIDDIENDLLDVDEKLNGENVNEKIRTANGQIAEMRKNINNLAMERNTKNQRLGQLKADLNRDENERTQLAGNDDRNKFIELCKAYTQQVYTDLHREYLIKEVHVKRSLTEAVNKIFKETFDSEFDLVVDAKYKIHAQNPQTQDVVGLSTAQSITVIFAFICAIIQLAKGNNDSDDSYSEQYPLVMDAPLSAFDKRRIKVICEKLPEQVEQVIIFIKDTDGELAEKYLGNRISVSRRFKQLDKFHTSIV
mgnify:CR=1 FL=1